MQSCLRGHSQCAQEVDDVDPQAERIASFALASARRLCSASNSASYQARASLMHAAQVADFRVGSRIRSVHEPQPPSFDRRQ